jgi:hypothetical protein
MSVMSRERWKESLGTGPRARLGRRARERATRAGTARADDDSIDGGGDDVGDDDARRGGETRRRRAWEGVGKDGEAGR